LSCTRREYADAGAGSPVTDSQVESMNCHAPDADDVGFSAR
jgi:hypothetical protein